MHRSSSNPAILKLGEILGLVLEAHGECLKALYVLFGEEVLIEILERTDEVATERSGGACLSQRLRQCFMEDRRVADRIHGEPDWPLLLERRVQSLSLPAVLEFYVWAYPPYRLWIESDLNLNWILRCAEQIEDPGSDESGGSGHPAISIRAQAENLVVEDWTARAESWISSLGLPEKIHGQVMRLTQPVWVRFRARVLSQAGGRRMSSV